MKKIPWTIQEIEIIKKNYQYMSRKKLLTLLPLRSLGSVSQKAKELNLVNYVGNKSHHSFIKYNKSFFKEITIANSYWAGFIAADGYIDNKNNKLRIKLALKDLQQLKDFAKEINFSGNIRQYNRNTNLGLNYKTCYIDLCGAKELLEDLKNNFNVTNKKSLTLHGPYNIKNTLCKLSYIKGFIDGDGSINKKGDRFEILAPINLSYWLLETFKDIEFEARIRAKKETDGLFVVYKTSLDLLFLIKNSCSFGLKRKWDRLPC